MTITAAQDSRRYGGTNSPHRVDKQREGFYITARGHYPLGPGIAGPPEKTSGVEASCTLLVTEPCRGDRESGVCCGGGCGGHRGPCSKCHKWHVCAWEQASKTAIYLETA